ncbi:hypothetical protein IAT38_005963 [Cryptococcus sp. DSM 104549]
MRQSIAVAAAAARQVVAPTVSTTHPTPYSWINPAAPSSSPGQLAGRSIAIKDNISFTEAPTSCSSAILEEYYPPYTATCVTSLLGAGAHIVGQTKMDEFGMGSQTTHLPSHYTPVHNPASPDPSEPPRSAGGSSGGSAAAVAEGSCWAALGTDTGGSVRLPASYCGVVGLKPSYGLVSRRGVVAYADSLDCVGVLARDVDTVQQVFETISHPDPLDMTCAAAPVRHLASTLLTTHSTLHLPSPLPLSSLRIGLPSSLPPPPLALLTHLRSLGATTHPISLPSAPMALPAYYVLASAEAASNLARFGGGWWGGKGEVEEGKREGESGAERRVRVRSEGFGREVRKRILAGTYALSADEFNNTYLKALYLRRLLRQDYQSAFRIPHPLSSPTPSSPPTILSDGVDLILHPTAIRTAPPLFPTESTTTADGQSEYLQDSLTVPASLAGLPAMSVPAGKDEDGWPVGVSVTGQWGMEGMVFRLGRAVEEWAEGQ